MQNNNTDNKKIEQDKKKETLKISAATKDRADAAI